MGQVQEKEGLKRVEWVMLKEKEGLKREEWVGFKEKY